MSATECASREVSVALEDDDAKVILHFLCSWAQPDPLCLNGRPSTKCKKVIGAYLRKLAREGTVRESCEEARRVLDGEDNNVSRPIRVSDISIGRTLSDPVTHGRCALVSTTDGLTRPSARDQCTKLSEQAPAC